MFHHIKKLFKDIITKGIYDLIKYLLVTLIVSITSLLYNFFVRQGKYLVPYTKLEPAKAKK